MNRKQRRALRSRGAEPPVRSTANIASAESLDTGADWDSTKRFTARIAAAMAADSPQRYLAKMTKSLRKGKIFIDYFRNSREATSVAVYSTRARAGAPISMPVTWEALPRTTAGNQFTILNSKKYVKADPWTEIGKVKQKLPE